MSRFKSFTKSAFNWRTKGPGRRMTWPKVLNATADVVEAAYNLPSDTEIQAIREPIIDKLADSLPGTLKVLDALAQLHPFVAVAVGAFRVVVSLEQKRRDNNDKIAMLFVEMRNMMAVLLDLFKIKDLDECGPDGKTIKAQIQELVEKTAEDIKSCANVCDTYGKQTLIARVIHVLSWENTLQHFLKVFVNRRREFAFALSIRTATNTEETKQKVEEMDRKLDKLLLKFSRLTPSTDQQELEELVKKKGGPDVVKTDEKALMEVLNFKSALAIGQAKHRPSRGSDDTVTEQKSSDQARDVGEDMVKALKQELHDDPTTSIANNLDVFNRKFDIQLAKLDEVKQMVRNTYEAVKAGAHDGINEPDIKKIWEDMKWPGQVKARRFVLALSEHYRQQIQSKHEAGNTWLGPEVDAWALEWISLSRLQAIAEAFDDDASGFITIAEVNEFAASRPVVHTKDQDLKWSLPHWLAYWAIGWQMTTTMYRDRIVNICAKMFAIRLHVHAANREAVDSYLRSVWDGICTLTSSFDGSYQTSSESLQGQFKDYVEAEEQRLRGGLEGVRYDVDAMNTLLLVTGPGRIEKHLFPLLWLMLCRDFKILRLCQRRVIHGQELLKSRRSIWCALTAVTQRHDNLDALFKQQKLDPGVQFKIFASGLFNHWHNSTDFWALHNLRGLEFVEVEYDDSKEDWQDIVNISELLHYPSVPLRVLRDAGDSTINDQVADEAVHKIVGRWMGVDFEANGATPRIFCLHASIDPMISKFWARGTNFNVIGDYTTKDNGTVLYTFTQAFTTTYIAARKKTIYWAGSLADDGETLSGKWGYNKDVQSYMFVYKRVGCKILHNDLLHLTASIDNSLGKDSMGCAQLTNADRERLFLSAFDLRAELDSNHDRCSYVFQDFRQRIDPVRWSGAYCDYCGNDIYGAHVMCMSCGSNTTFDFCDKPECMGCTIKTRYDITSPHRPTHDLVKFRTPYLYLREIGKLLRNANAGLERAKKLLRQSEGEEKDEHGLATFWPGEKTVTQAAKEEAAAALPLTCLRCHGLVSQPCWYCIDCPEDTKALICWDCDEGEAGFSHGEHHRGNHNLVRCLDGNNSKFEDNETEQRLVAVDHKLEGLTRNMEGLTNQVEGLTSQMTVFTNQMESIEKLLRSLGNEPAQ